MVITIHNFKEELVALVNRSGLPFCITAEILRNLTYELDRGAVAEYKKAIIEAQEGDANYGKSD